MEEIIGEHLSSLKSFRSLGLIFDLDPPFIKNSIFGIKAYQKEGIYLNEKQEGLWISWYENGQKRSEGNYRNGKREKLWIYWYENGQKALETNYVNEEQEGWVSWDRSGNLTKIDDSLWQKLKIFLS